MRNSYKMHQRQQRLRSIHNLFQLSRPSTSRPESTCERAPLMMEAPDYEGLEEFGLPGSGRSVSYLSRCHDLEDKADDLRRNKAYHFIFQIIGLSSPQHIVASFFRRLLIGTGLLDVGRYGSHLQTVSAPRLFHLFLSALSWGWRVASRWFLLVHAMAFARLYDIAKQYGLVQTEVSTVGGLTSAPFARRRSIALFGPRPISLAESPSGSIWSTAMPHILNLTQRIQALETGQGQANAASDFEREDVLSRLFVTTRAIEDLAGRLGGLENKSCQDTARLGGEILEVQLKHDFLKLEGDVLRHTNSEFAAQLEEFRDAIKQLQLQITGRDNMVSKLLFDVATLFKDNEVLAKKGCALEAQLLDAQRSIREKDAALIELQNAMPDPQKLGTEFARLQNRQLDSCVFKREEDSEDSIIIITEDQSKVQAGDEPKSDKEYVKLTGNITPSPSGTQLEIPVFISPRPSLPPKKAKLKPLLLASRFTTSASSRRLLGRKRSAVSLRTPENKTTKALNPKAAEFKPRHVVPVVHKAEDALNPATTPLLVTKRLPNLEMTPRTTRATSVRLIKSRVVSRTSKMKSSHSKEGLTSSLSRVSIKGGLAASVSRSALGEVTNLNV